MATRLLSLLSLIETALVDQGCSVLQNTAQRTVNFHKGLARLLVGNEGGAILVQSFTLADGQVCVKAALTWPGSELIGSEAIYPKGETYNWRDAAERIARAWLIGPADVLRPTTASANSPLADMPALAAVG